MFPIHESCRSTVYEYYLKSDSHINFVIFRPVFLLIFSDGKLKRIQRISGTQTDCLLSKYERVKFIVSMIC